MQWMQMQIWVIACTYFQKSGIECTLLANLLYIGGMGIVWGNKGERGEKHFAEMQCPSGYCSEYC